MQRCIRTDGLFREQREAYWATHRAAELPTCQAGFREGCQSATAGPQNDQCLAMHKHTKHHGSGLGSVGREPSGADIALAGQTTIVTGESSDRPGLQDSFWEDTWRMVFQFLSSRDVSAATAVCRTWQSAVQGVRRLDISPWGGFTVPNRQQVADAVPWATSLTAVVHLSLAFCERLTDRTLVELLQGLARLESLDVTFCHQLTDRSLTAIRDLGPKINALNISCNQLADGLGDVAPQLFTLVCRACPNVDSAALGKIAAGCRDGPHPSKLQVLDLQGCPITAPDPGEPAAKSELRSSLTGLAAIAAHCPNLETLNLEQCDGIATKESVAACVKVFRRTHSLVEVHHTAPDPRRGDHVAADGGLDIICSLQP